MKITYDWLKDHLQTKNSENQLLDKLTGIGLEVEGVENTSADLDKFIIEAFKTPKELHYYSSYLYHIPSAPIELQHQ